MEMNIHDAKTHFSSLLRRVAGGEEVVIARAGVPVAKLVAVEPPCRPRPVGMDRGKFKVPDDFDAPLPDDLLKLFYGGTPPRLVGEKKKIKRRHRP